MKKLLSLLTAVATLASQAVTFEWDLSPDPTVKGYRMYWGSESNVFTVSRPAGSTNNFTFTNTLFTPNIPYYFVVVATNVINIESLPSNTVVWTNVVPPSAPKNLRVSVVTNTAGPINALKP